MKTLSDYKARYRKAVKLETKAKIMNKAMLNLSHLDQDRFIKWQTERALNQY